MLAQAIEQRIEVTRDVGGDDLAASHQDAMGRGAIRDPNLSFELAEIREHAIEASFEREHLLDIARTRKAPKFLQAAASWHPRSR